MSKPRVRYPLKLPLSPGLRWTGHLTVEGPVGQAVTGEPTFLAHFDAEIVNSDEPEKFVFDRTVLTATQIHAWTGVNLDMRTDIPIDVEQEGR